MCSIEICQQINKEESVKDRQRKCTCLIRCKSMKKLNQFIDINFPLSWASTQLLCPWGNIIDQLVHSFIHSLIHLTSIEIWAPTTCQKQSYMRLSVGPQWVRQTSKWPITAWQGQQQGLYKVLRDQKEGPLSSLPRGRVREGFTRESNIWAQGLKPRSRQSVGQGAYY